MKLNVRGLMVSKRLFSRRLYHESSKPNGEKKESLLKYTTDRKKSEGAKRGGMSGLGKDEDVVDWSARENAYFHKKNLQDIAKLKKRLDEEERKARKWRK